MGKHIKPGTERIYLHGRVIRVVPQVEAARMVRRGTAAELYRNGVYMGVELQDKRGVVADVRTAKSGATKSAQSIVMNDPDARRSCVVLSRKEVEAIADRRASRTEGLSFSDPRRDARIARGLSEMDQAEAARVKFNAMFPDRPTQEVRAA